MLEKQLLFKVVSYTIILPKARKLFGPRHASETNIQVPLSKWVEHDTTAAQISVRMTKFSNSNGNTMKATYRNEKLATIMDRCACVEGMNNSIFWLLLNT